MTRHVVTPNIVQTRWTVSFSPDKILKFTDILYLTTWLNNSCLESVFFWFWEHLSPTVNQKFNISGSLCCFLKYLALDSAVCLKNGTELSCFVDSIYNLCLWYREKKKTHLLETWGQTFQRHSECKRENSVLMSGLQTKVKWSSSGGRKSLKTISQQSIWWWDISVWTKRGQSDYCMWTLSVNWFSRVLVFYLVIHVLLFPLVQTFIWEFAQYECCFFTCQQWKAGKTLLNTSASNVIYHKKRIYCW